MSADKCGHDQLTLCIPSFDARVSSDQFAGGAQIDYVAARALVGYKQCTILD
jgi:hypothetical protein